MSTSGCPIGAFIVDFEFSKLSKVSLFTGQDQFLFVKHPHAALGFLSLINTLYRTYRLWSYGPSNVFSSFTECVLVALLHFLVNVTSFIFKHVPKASSKVKGNPQIWDEYRIHNILFASRHLMGMIVNTFWFPQKYLLCQMLRVIFVITVHFAADLTTHFWGDEKRGSTIAQFMKMLTVNTDWSKSTIDRIGYFQRIAQIGAIFNALLCANPAINFFTLFPIQISSFFMTLNFKMNKFQRSNPITIGRGAKRYTYVYTFALFMVYPVTFVCFESGKVKQKDN